MGIRRETQPPSSVQKPNAIERTTTLRSIVVTYKPDSLDDPEQQDRLSTALRTLCNHTFFTECPDGFDVQFVKLAHSRGPTHHVVVTLSVPNILGRVDSHRQDLSEIRDQTLVILASYGHPEGTSVRVIIYYGELRTTFGVL